MDDAEYAQNHEEFLYAAKIRAMREEIAARKEAPQALDCEACGDSIPAERRAAQPGCTLCVRCKDLQERSAPCLSVD